MTVTTEFAGVVPSNSIFQKLRLMLSTYQDGSGQLVSKKSQKTLPGWRDFERTAAIVFQGKAQESKAIFDVIVPDGNEQGLFYGISCKMRGTLKETINKKYVSLELSNSSKQFWNAIDAYGITEQTYRNHPAVVGKALIERVERWHKTVGIESDGCIVLNKSFYLTLSWDERSEKYQLHQFKHILPDPTALTWDFPKTKHKEELVEGNRLVGKHGNHKLLEWYGRSGGQLKYYPVTQDAIWQSELFELEPLPKYRDLQTVIMEKIHNYFPEQWADINDNA